MLEHVDLGFFHDIILDLWLFVIKGFKFAIFSFFFISKKNRSEIFLLKTHSFSHLKLDMKLSY